MNKSIRQPILVYAMTFMMVIAFVVVTIASFALVQASRRAYRRATHQELRAIAAHRTPGELRAIVATQSYPGELVLGLVSSSSSSFSLDLAGARREASAQRYGSPFVSVPVLSPGEELYLVGQLDPAIPTSIAFVEISRMVPMVLFGALASAAVLAFMIGRLLLPPLNALAEVAAETRPDEGFGDSEAPYEIHDVAQRFRQTVRLLNQERELIKSQKDELERMQESLVRASKLASVGRLAAGIAHEIGNPLAAVQGYLTLLRGGLDPTTSREVLERSTKELARIHETIKKLLTYARKGEEATEPATAFASGRVVEEALALVRGHPAMRNVKVENRLTDPERIDALGHSGRLNQVLVNLFLNAAQAMEACDAPRITVHQSERDGHVELYVEDSGPGVPQDKVEAIFDPFFTTKAPGEGTGLGLAVSRALMETMNGDLFMETTVSDGGGACFVVRMKAAAGPVSGANPQGSAE